MGGEGSYEDPVIFDDENDAEWIGEEDDDDDDDSDDSEGSLQEWNPPAENAAVVEGEITTVTKEIQKEDKNTSHSYYGISSCNCRKL